MKLLTTIYDINNMSQLSKADGFLLGSNQYATRLTKSFNSFEINQAISLAKKLDKEIFLLANQMFDDDMIKSFKLWIKDINILDLTGIVIADVGTYYALKKIGLQDKLIYNPETLMTNYYDFNFLVEHGIYGVYIAKEITLEDIKMIADKKQTKLFMVGHGYLNMFYSKRQLINNYMDYIDQENILHDKQNVKIIEEKRSEDPYPILEDQAGTHVFRSKVFDSYQYLDELEPIIDYLVIDTIFESDQYAKDILDLYKHEQTVAAIEEKYQETWDNGFFFKKTIYKQGVKK